MRVTTDGQWGFRSMSRRQEKSADTPGGNRPVVQHGGVRKFGKYLETCVCGGAIVGAGAIPAAGLGWGADLIANFGALAAMGTVAGLLTGMALRRWRLVGVLGVVLLVHGAYALRPRAASSDGPVAVRLLIHNIRSLNTDVGAVVANIRSSGADVVVLVDMSPEYVRAMRDEADLADLYPFMLRRGPVPDLTGWRVVLSRWPLEDHRTPTELRCVVQKPGGAFALLVLHPASPRDGGRWRRGNGLVEQAAAAARGFAVEGLPVIVAGDLNSTPTGWRDRQLCRRGGLRRCKPWLGSVGTFPAWVPGMFRLALDDAWVSAEWRVGSWRVGDRAGSDHVSVFVELVLEVASSD